jgi:hypothetical protein
VFDGHGGRRTVDYIEKHLHTNLAALLPDGKTEPKEAIQTDFGHTPARDETLGPRFLLQLDRHVLLSGPAWARRLRSALMHPLSLAGAEATPSVLLASAGRTGFAASITSTPLSLGDFWSWQNPSVFSFFTTQLVLDRAALDQRSGDLEEKVRTCGSLLGGICSGNFMPDTVVQKATGADLYLS